LPSIPLDLQATIAENKKLVERVQEAEQQLEEVSSEHQKELNHLSKDLTSWKDRALKAEDENRQLTNKLIEWKDHILKAEGQTGGIRSHTPLELPRSSQVTVYLDNLSDVHIKYSYRDAGELIEGFVPPAENIPVLCLLHHQYTFNVTDGTAQRYIRQVINRDNQKIVLWGII